MTPTYLLGDHHCPDHHALAKVIAKRGLRNCRLIHLGDGEEGYPSHRDDQTPEKLNGDFAKLGIEYLSIRGNHCNPNVFDGSVMLPNFKLIPDYTRMQIGGETWLFVGGAVSIDRINRIPNETWWPEEEMVLDESRAQAADVLVTHTGPSWTLPPRSDLVDHYAAAEATIATTTLKQELRAEADRHDRLFELVKPRVWYHGHHHRSATHHHGGCTIRQLSEAELFRHISASNTGQTS